MKQIEVLPLIFVNALDVHVEDARRIDNDAGYPLDVVRRALNGLVLDPSRRNTGRWCRDMVRRARRTSHRIEGPASGSPMDFRDAAMGRRLRFAIHREFPDRRSRTRIECRIRLRGTCRVAMDSMKQAARRPRPPVPMPGYSSCSIYSSSY